MYPLPLFAPTEMCKVVHHFLKVLKDKNTKSKKATATVV
jgi:hypothetical protein